MRSMQEHNKTNQHSPRNERGLTHLFFIAVLLNTRSSSVRHRNSMERRGMIEGVWRKAGLYGPVMHILLISRHDNALLHQISESQILNYRTRTAGVAATAGVIVVLPITRP
jgi:hypothetical protein